MSCIPSAIVSDDLNLWFHDHISVGCYRIAVGYYRTLAQNNKNAETNESSIQKFLKTTNIIRNERRMT